MERPILFSTPMVQAIMDGRKTMTRRIVKPQPPKECEDDDPIIDWCDYDHEKGWQGCYIDWEMAEGDSHAVKSPYGKVGDLIWVCETFNQSGGTIRYKASPEIVYKTKSIGVTTTDLKWKPSIHMPKSACRIWLEITNIRVERLQDISEEDAIDEGVESPNPCGGCGSHWKPCIGCMHPFSKVMPRYKFFQLWKSINGEQSWNDNPWVWVVEFKKIDKK